MTLYAIIPLLAAVASLGLAILVNRHRGGTDLARVFTVVAIMLVAWNLHFVALYSLNDHDAALRWAGRFRWGSILLHPAIMHLMTIVHEGRRRWWNIFLAVDYLGGLVLCRGDQLGWIVADLRQFPWGYYSVGGPWYRYFTLYFFANSALAISLLTHGYRRASDPRRILQLRFWLLGVYVALPLGATNLLPAYGVGFYPLGNLGNVAWAAIMTYAIVRHRLMDIDLAITRGAAFVGGAALVVIPAVAASVAFQPLAFGTFNVPYSAALVVLFGGVAVGFNAVRTALEARISAGIFKARSESRSALLALARSIVRIFDQQKILQELGVTLSRCLNVQRVVIALGDAGKPQLGVAFGLGEPCADLDLSLNGPLVRFLARTRGAVLAEEAMRADAAAGQAMVVNGFAACLPLVVHDRLLGFVALGGMRDPSLFYSENLELLEAVGGEAAVAIENARLYDALRASQDLIQRADRSSALGVLAAGIAHEIRNPLVSIQTFFQLAPDRLDDPEFVTSFLSTAAGEVKRISMLVNELLSFARSPVREIRPTDLVDVIDGVVTLLGPEARRRNVALVKTSPDVSLVVQGNSEQLKQVVLNIAYNALQATPAGGRVSLAGRLVAFDSIEFAQIEVRDTGCGVPLESLEAIFDPFFTTKERGTGLGLAISRQIVAEHQGRIRVDSAPGEGSTFFVEIPR